MKIALPLLVLCASLNAAAASESKPQPPSAVAKPNFGQQVSAMAHKRNETRKKAKGLECKPANAPVALPVTVVSATAVWSDMLADFGDDSEGIVHTSCNLVR